MATITNEELIAYYVNLLIIQYSSNQPKAQDTIALIAKELTANNVFFDVQNAYDLIGTSSIDWDSGDWDSGGIWDSPDTGDIFTKTASGKQLNVIGKYLGVDRFYTSVPLEDYFSLITYDECAAPPASPPRFGFETYATFGEYNYNGTLVYDDIVTVQNALSDKDFLTIIRLAILKNNMNYSHKAIDDALYKIFADSFRVESTGNMTMYIFISGVKSTLISCIIFKKLFPRPMGVGLGIVDVLANQMFGFTDYYGSPSPFAYGFSDYSNYATLNGQVLTYDNITAG